jgi:hypothetical protein
MQPQDGSSPIRITLDISVPVDGGRGGVQMHPVGPCDGRQPTLGGTRDKSLVGIDHPDNNGSTQVKQICGRWYMCAHGTADSTRHVFARVYEGNETPVANPPPGTDTGWASVINSTAWKIDLLPLPAGTSLATTKKLAVWYENGSGGYHLAPPHTFTVASNNYTYCETYGVTAEVATAKKPAAKDWCALPDRWQFTIAGVSGGSSANCGCLDGTWVLKREDSALLWSRQLDTSFADAKGRCWWRLSFNQQDGFWYLECVGDTRQPVGTSIAYRRHESAWDPRGANELLLLTDHGYCNVPEFVTLYPA